MGIFDFMSEGVEEAIHITQQQVERLQAIVAHLEQGIARLQEGGWYGEAADSFFDESDLFIVEMNQLISQKVQFIETLSSVQHKVNDTMKTIINNLRS